MEPQVMVPSVGDLEAALVAFRWALKAQIKSTKTIETCSEAVSQLGAFLSDHGMPTVAAAITREHVEMCLAEMVSARASTTASNRYRALKRSFAYLPAEGDVTSDPR